MLKFGLIVSILGSSIVLAAQDTLRNRPTLNDHTFIPVSAISPAFTNTSVMTYMGVGQTIDFRYPLFELPNGEMLSLKGDVSFVDINLDYQYQVQDWLGVYVRLKVAARLGTEIQSILSQGINTIASSNIGWNFHILETEKLKLTGIFELQSHEGNFINVWGYISDIINDEPNPSITNTIPLIVGATGFRFAYGINETYGFRFDSKLSWGETYIRESTGFRYSLTTAFDMDLYPKYDIPLGLSGAVMVTTQPDLVYVEHKTGRLFILKIAYTGSSDYSLGIEYSQMRIPLNYASEVPRIVNFAFVAKYYF